MSSYTSDNRSLWSYNLSLQGNQDSQNFSRPVDRWYILLLLSPICPTVFIVFHSYNVCIGDRCTCIFMQGQHASRLH